METAAPPYSPSRSLYHKAARRMTQWRTVKPLGRDPASAIVSFTFDDFPKSAATAGAKILEAAGGRGTYYACTGMAGQANTMGDLFDAGDLARLSAAGHEIGAHTHLHLDCAQASTERALEDVDVNLAQLRDMGVAGRVTQFAFPFGETRTSLKRQLASRFDACRGILPGRNCAQSDLTQLRAFELDGTDARTDAALKAIRQLRHSPAWIVLFTHDVSDLQSGYGVTEAVLERLVGASVSAGAALLTMSEALAAIREVPA
ncbi:MAG: polysaccharide deacetylase family protein [Hyphomonas sp.]|nr:polysaccharide deacetylase family protein [Hyphomonas sp.]